MPNFQAASRSLLALALLLLVALPGRAELEWRDPLDSAGAFEPTVLVDPAILTEPAAASFGSDPCGCLRELRVCLIGASISLGRCLARAQSPARQALCYLKFELDILLCLEQAGRCQLICVP